ncbi:unnamed protein product [Cuscuta europaea]|uniref:Retrotransposon gag domain-containing protein n=1 Tax=Cuscuta europaea TaxID=41803 RepID=A0A9P0ZTX6_CUSEU|nr:unnamed protein product [Cuscuta europaea]
MQVVPDRKLMVATRLLEGLASTWWEGIKGKFDRVVAWDNFEQSFYEHFYTSFEVNRKRREYTNLKQANEFTVKQLEQRFRHLTRFLSEYAVNEDRMANHFWNALNFEVRERATYQFNMTFSQVVAQGLQREELWGKGKQGVLRKHKKGIRWSIILHDERESMTFKARGTLTSQLRV